ncbi:MAG: putative zinc-binding metallopeptidase [Rhodospirillales bacterium]
MKAFKCTCGQPLFFDNLECLSCGAQVAYDPLNRTLATVQPTSDGLWMVAGGGKQATAAQFRLCAHRTTQAACNWLVPADEPQAICLSCRLTRTVPLLDDPKDEGRLRDLEAAKRLVLYALQEMDLPLVPKSQDAARGLAFDFLEPLPGGPPVLTGHDEGVITLNVAEADDDYREKNRENLREPYRTLVGHIRHEIGHYYWDVLIRDTPWLSRYREVFGDERADYGEALNKHYAEGPPPNWRDNFISAYAASHPWEDWAESWAHYLHMQATLETVASFRVQVTDAPLRLTPFSADDLYDPNADTTFLDWVNSWVILTATLNEVARSMGQPDIYPFVLSRPAVKKIHFVHCLISDYRVASTPLVPETLVASTA